MPNKRRYTAPEIFEVKLNPEQAVLTACSITATSLFDQGNARCKPPGQGLATGCKNGRTSGSGGGDSGARMS